VQVLTKRNFSLILSLVFAVQISYGQTNNFEKAEKELRAHYAKLFSFYNADQDSLYYYSDFFTKSFTSFIKNNPATLNYQFKNLIDSNICSVVTSRDNEFRIYSWDTWLGGTMHNFKNLFQFKSDNKVYSTYLKTNKQDFGTYFTDIFTLKANNKTYYLTVSGGSESTKDAYETIRIYTISKDLINDKVKLIKTRSGLQNSISYEYDFFSVVDRPE